MAYSTSKNGTNGYESPWKRRSRTEILEVLLECCAQGMRKSSLMRTANLSSGAVNDYLNFLVDRELVHTGDKGSVYHLTDEGRNALDRVSSAHACLGLTET